MGQWESTDEPNGVETNGTKYQILEENLGHARHLRVITVGAGASGLNLAYQLERFMQNVEHIIYEKNPEVGGTWYENRYPGCACDIPSHNYQFTWEPYAGWTNFYSPAPEILEYFKGVARKYNLYKYIRLSHRVIEAEWNEKEAVWNLRVENLADGSIVNDWCHFMISGSGILNNWKWPDIPGIHSFKGDLVHTAAWDPSVDFHGKDVAVLGCGSSGVQIIPTLQPDVKSLTTFLRTPTWITAGFAQSKAGPNGANFAFSKERKAQFAEEPQVYLDYRKEIEQELNARFKFVLKDSPEQAAAKQYSINEMKDKLGHDSPLLKHIIPDFAVGCRRPTPGNGYLEALTRSNVRVATDAIQEVVPEGIKLVTGEVIKVQMFICATGFDISFKPRYPVKGRHGIDLGPNAPIGHGSVLPIVEQAAKYIIQMLFKCQTQGYNKVVPKQQAAADFSEHINEFMKRTAWSTHCRSWFKNGKVDGPIVALHPGSRVHWFHMLDAPRFEDYEWETLDRNRFSYLGNGFSVREVDGRDSAYYFDNPARGLEHIQY